MKIPIALRRQIAKMVTNGLNSYLKQETIEIHEQNEIIFTRLKKSRGIDFVEDVKSLMKAGKASSSRLFITKLSPSGIKITKRDLRVIDSVWIDNSRQDGLVKVTLQVTPKQYVSFHYQS